MEGGRAVDQLMEQWKGQKVELVGREQLAQNTKQKGKLNDKKRGSN
jgi:hypothetical protein